MAVKRNGLGFYALGSIVLTICVASTGMSEATADDAYKMGAVVVTATRYEESLANVPANVTVVTEKDIQNTAAQDVPELLRTIAGVHVSDVAGNRRNYVVDLRGFDEIAGMNTLVLVDGRRTNQADLSGTDWSQIPLDRVERIEIIRGARACILYGDNASAGVINILTKKGTGFKAGAEVSGGSYDTFKTNAYVRGSEKKFTYALSGSYLTSDGYRDNSNTEAKDTGIDLGYALGDAVSFQLSHGYHKDNTSLPGALKRSNFEAGARRTDTVQPNDFADTEDYYFKGGPEIYFLSNSMIKLDTSYRKREVTNYASGDWGYFEGGFDIDTISFTPQIVMSEKILGKENTLTAGFDYVRAKEDITNTSKFFGSLSTALADMEKKNHGIYLHDEYMLLSNLGLSAGYRYDRAKYEFSSSLPISGPDHTRFDEELYTVGVNYRIAPTSNIYANFSRGFRFPALDELFNFYSNSISGLASQTSNDFEIGFRHALSDTLSAGLNLFHVRTKDEIFYNLAAYANQNMDGDTERKGIEVSLDKNFHWWTIGLAYTYTDAKVDGGTFDGKDIPNVPSHQASIKTLLVLWKPFTISLNGTYIGKRPFISDFGNRFKDQDEFFVANAKLKYRWKNATAFIDINNLFNKSYSEYGVLGGFPTEQAYYPSPKTHFIIGASLEM
jgi:iron complex outermembrane recepter protein